MGRCLWTCRWRLSPNAKSTLAMLSAGKDSGKTVGSPNWPRAARETEGIPPSGGGSNGGSGPGSGNSAHGGSTSPDDFVWPSRPRPTADPDHPRTGITGMGGDRNQSGSDSSGLAGSQAWAGSSGRDRRPGAHSTTAGAGDVISGTGTQPGLGDSDSVVGLGGVTNPRGTGGFPGSGSGSNVAMRSGKGNGSAAAQDPGQGSSGAGAGMDESGT